MVLTKQMNLFLVYQSLKLNIINVLELNVLSWDIIAYWTVTAHVLEFAADPAPVIAQCSTDHYTLFDSITQQEKKNGGDRE
jgi:hypothetical protein